MFLGPIFGVELVTGGRRLRFVLVRTLYAAILLVALWISFESFGGPYYAARTNLETTANFAAQFFDVFAWTQLLAVLVVAPAVTAGSIAQERERRTLEHLFASDLRDREIVLGKYAARVLSTLYFAIAGLPVLQIASLLGGIDPESLWLVFAITLSTMLTISAVALAMSVWAKRAREAITGTYLVLFCWLLLPFPVVSLLGVWGAAIGPGSWTDVVTVPLWASNPLYALGIVASDSSGMGLDSPWTIVGRLLLAHGLLSALCLGASVWGVRRVQRKQASEGAGRRRWRLPLWRPALGDRAMLWKEMFAERSASRLGLVARIARGSIVLFVVVVALWQFVDSLLSPLAAGENPYASNGDTSYYAQGFVGAAMTLATLTASLGLLLCTARAATLVGSERERDCWISLIGTDLSAAEIVTAKVVGNLYAARGLWLLLAFLYLLAAIRHPPFVLALPFLVAAVAAVAWFVSGLGVWFSLWCRTSMRAMGAAVALVAFVGGGYWFCCWPVAFAGSLMDDEAAIFFLTPTVPFLLGAPAFVALAAGTGLGADTTAAISAAYLLGTLGYAAAGGAIWWASIANFDQLAGRISRRAPAIRTGAADGPQWVSAVSTPPE